MSGSLVQVSNTEMYSNFLFHPEGPKSNQHEISPYNINALENRAGLRIEYMIRKEDESN